MGLLPPMDFARYEDDLTKTMTAIQEEGGWTGQFDAFLSDGESTVIVPPGEAQFAGAMWVYIGLSDGRKQKTQVANTYAGIPYNNDWAHVEVRCGYPPGETHQLEIMKVTRKGLLLTNGQLPSQREAAVNAHLSPERWEPLKIYAGTNLNIALQGGYFQWMGQLIYLYSNPELADASGSLPATSGMAAYVLVCVHPVTGAAVLVEGDEFENVEQPDNFALMPKVVPLGHMVLGHVRLYEGQTAWGSGDVVRASLPFFTPPGTARVLIEDQKTSGTPGGTFTTGAWQPRDLNTEVLDTHGLASVTSNQITLLMGGATSRTWGFEIRCPGNRVGRHQARLWNDTTSAEIKVGTSTYSDPDDDYAQTESVIKGQVTITEDTTFEIQHQCEFTYASQGFGVECDFGATEIYTTAEFWLES
jgi:hypothetical protein